MSILHYFQNVPKTPSQALQSASTENDAEVSVLNLSSRETEEVTKEVVVLENKGAKRGKYIKWTAEERAEIGEHAVRNGVTQTVRHFKGKYPRITKQTVSDFKKAFIKAKQAVNGPVSEIGFRKRGRPALLPDDLMTKTIETIEALRLKGAPVTAPVINAIAKGIVMANDRTILVEHGGYLSLSYDWGRNVLYRMAREGKKMAMRMATTAKIPVAPGLLQEVKLSFQRKIKTLKEKYSVPEDLILNFDQTPLSYVSSGSHTLHNKGAKSVPLVGKGKKKQITGTFTVTMSGNFLPMQLIYEGKTPRSLPQGITFPDGFNLTFTPNHWSNEDKVIEHLEKIVFPFVTEKRKELELADNQKAMLIFDVFKGQKTDRVHNTIANNNCVSVFVPANMTNYFQPLDLTVNGAAKQFLKGKFQEWYATEIASQVNEGVDVYSIDISTKLSVMKPIHARWLAGLYDHIRNKPDLIRKGFEMAGIVEAINKELEPEDPFEDLV